MNEEIQHRLRQEDLAFFGRVGADVSHEMRNVLSVIGEYAGLLDDLLGLAERAKRPDYVKLRRLSTNIAKQVRKGTETMERFSRFAHAADEPKISFDLTAAMENMAALAQRRVTRAGCGLETELPHQAIPVSSSPFSLQRAVFSALQLILDSPEKGDLVRIQLARQGLTAVISISGNVADGGELPDGVSRLSDVMNELTGTVETSRADGILSFRLTIPIM
jgi:signal transduction histidine kinase